MNELQLKLELEKLRFEIEQSNSKKRALLHSKLAELKSICNGLEKDGNNTFSRYQYITYAQMYALVSANLLKVKLDIIASVKSIEMSREEGKKGYSNIATVNGIISIIDTDTGFVVNTEWYAQGYDTGDKALTKADTFLMKSWISANLMVSSDDVDPDEDTVENRSIIPNRESIQKPPYDNKKDFGENLRNLILTKYADSNRVKEVLKSRGFTFNDVQNIEGKIGVDIYNEV